MKIYYNIVYVFISKSKFETDNRYYFVISWIKSYIKQSIKPFNYISFVSSGNKLYGGINFTVSPDNEKSFGASILQSVSGINISHLV